MCPNPVFILINLYFISWIENGKPGSIASLTPSSLSIVVNKANKNTKGQRFTWKSCKKITLRAFNVNMCTYICVWVLLINQFTNLILFSFFWEQIFLFFFSLSLFLKLTKWNQVAEFRLKPKTETHREQCGEKKAEKLKYKKRPRPKETSKRERRLLWNNFSCL